MTTLEDISKKKKVYPSLKQIEKWNYSGLCPIKSINNRHIIDKSSIERYKSEEEVITESLKVASKYEENIYIPYKYQSLSRIATFNIHNFINYCSNEKPRSLSIYKKFIESIKADVLCMQELVPYVDNEKELTKYTNIDFSSFIDMLKKLGYVDFLICNSMNDTNVIDEKICYYLLTNGIFSKNKFKYKNNYKLSGNRCINIVVTHDDLFIVNVHMEYTNKNRNIDNLKELQVSELNNIYQKESIKLNKKFNLKGCLLLGDLNNSINNKLFEVLQKQFVILKKENLTRLKLKKSFNLTTDYILFNKLFLENFKVLRNVSIKMCLSDHFPVILDYINNDNTNIDNIKKKIKLELMLSDDIYNLNIPDNKQFYSLRITNTMIDNTHFGKSWFGMESKIECIESRNIKNFFENYSKIYPYYKKYLDYLKYFNNDNTFSFEKTGSIMFQIKENIEDMILHYLKSIKNIKTIVLWPESKFYSRDINKLVNLLKSKGKIYYQKQTWLSYSSAQSLIYQLYIHTDRNKTFNHLNFNVEQKGWKNRNMKLPIKIFFYEYLGDQNEISGSLATFKNELRDTLKTNEMRIYDILHINDTFQEALDNSSIFLNNNSIKLLSKMNMKRFIEINNSSSGTKSVMMVNTLKKILFNNFDLISINRFIFNSSIVLYTHTQRAVNDIDGYVFMGKTEQIFNEQYEKFFYADSNNSFPTFDLSAKGTPRYEDYITKFYDKVANILKISDYDEVIFNPQYHYYFFGLKINILQLEIIKKMYRYKPKSYADLIALNVLKKCNIKFPKIPQEIKYYYKDSVNEKYIIKNISHHLKSLYNIDISVEDITKKYFVNKNISSNINNYNINEDKNVFDNYLNIKC